MLVFGQVRILPLVRAGEHTPAMLVSQLRFLFCFCRGVVRQLGKPALLAATYKGDVAAIATAAMEELESTLVDSISQLERFSPGSGTAQLYD